MRDEYSSLKASYHPFMVSGSVSLAQTAVASCHVAMGLDVLWIEVQRDTKEIDGAGVLTTFIEPLSLTKKVGCNISLQPQGLLIGKSADDFLVGRTRFLEFPCPEKLVRVLEGFPQFRPPLFLR